MTRITCHGRGNKKTVLRGLQGSQSEPLLALIFLRSSHSDDWLPHLFVSVHHLELNLSWSNASVNFHSLGHAERWLP